MLTRRFAVFLVTLSLLHGTVVSLEHARLPGRGRGLPQASSSAAAADDPAGASADPLSEERVPLAAIPPKRDAPRLESRVFQAAAGAPTQRLEEVAAQKGMVARDGNLQVVIEIEPEAADLVGRTVVANGGAVQGVFGGLVQAMIPPAALDLIIAQPGVRFVRAPNYGVNSGIDPEGLETVGLRSWREFGFSGRGAKIAVADLGFDGYRNLLASELPSNAVVRSFRSDGDITGAGNPHGTAAAEIVYDIAPDATMYLVNFSTEVELGKAVDWLISEGVQVISSSVGWPGSSYGDGAGAVNEIIRQAERAGIVWVQAAGNYGNTHWTGLFNDPDGNGFHNFSGNDEGNTIFLRRSRPAEERVFRIEVFLTWDDWDTFRQDYDLFLFQGDKVVAQSTAFQNGQFPPIEHIVYTSATQGDYWIAIQRFRATRRVKLDLAVTIDYNLEYQVPAESIVPPGDSRDAITVGAVEPDTLNLRPYSAQGPTKDGRTKPDLVAPDRVSTATYGPGGFTGTSASVPYVGGVAALIKGARPGIPPSVVRSMLLQRATGPGAAAMNNQVGAGYVTLGELPTTLAFPIVVRRAPLPP